MKKFIILIVAIVTIIITVLSIGVFGVENAKDPIAAGDVCNIHLVHECELCNEQSDVVIADVISGTCPRCNIGNLQSVCSKENTISEDGTISYVYMPCDDESHPDGCQIKQTYCYTSLDCVNDECDYFSSGFESHLETYEHTLEPSCKDNSCCTLLVVPLST